MTMLWEYEDFRSTDVAHHIHIITQAFAQWESVLSRFQSDSELNCLHIHPDQWLTCSPTLWSVLRTADWAYQWSNGLVDPTIRTALERAGYHHSRHETTHQHNTPTTTRDSSLGWSQVEFDLHHQRIRIPAGVRIDLAGVAKSWAAQQALTLIPEATAFALDAAGDIAVRGTPRDYHAWPIDIEPLAGYRDSGILAIDDAHSIATSGIDKRHWQQAGRLQHHIIDPRTGQPSNSDVIRASVIAPTVIQADVAARVCVILGYRAALLWMKQNPELTALVHTTAGATHTIRNWQSFAWPNA